MNQAQVSDTGMIYIVGGAVDEHGQPVRRTKQEHPYSYDGFIVWRGGDNTEAQSTIYSDRLTQ